MQVLRVLHSTSSPGSTIYDPEPSQQLSQLIMVFSYHLALFSNANACFPYLGTFPKPSTHPRMRLSA